MRLRNPGGPVVRSVGYDTCQHDSNLLPSLKEPMNLLIISYQKKNYDKVNTWVLAKLLTHGY